MSVLVNFRMSDHLKVGLDHIADMKHTTKTSIINDLITTYVRSEYRQYITDRELVRKVVKKDKPIKTKSVNEKVNFIEYRITSVDNDLKLSEKQLKIFNEQNRQLTSPSLQLEQDRISRG